MKMLTTRAEFKKKLGDAIAMEVGARNMYKQDISVAFKNKHLIEVISGIESDEERHIRVINEIINML